MRIIHIIFPLLTIITNFGCSPFANYSDTSDPDMYQADNINNPTTNPEQIKVVTWNIRWGGGRLEWFGDSCGDVGIADYDSVEMTMQKIADTLNVIDADIVLLQEIDVESKRSGYMNQVQFLLNNTNLNYGVYAPLWEVDFIPTDGLGRVNAGNAILSKYKLTEAEKIKLRLRTDQSSLIKYFYLRRNILKVKIPDLIQDNKDFYAVDIHATAFATDDTKQKHISKYFETLAEIQNGNDLFVTGGDLNSVPPGSVIDFCESDKCEGEVCDEDYKNNEVYQASYFNHFEGEPDILIPFYSSYYAAVNLTDANDTAHYSHAPSTNRNSDGSLTKYDRKLSYLFTNINWMPGSGKTHQSAWQLSDHMPVSGIVILENR